MCISDRGYYYFGHGARENIPPFSPLQLLLWVCCWVITGAYATLSWRRGGQTLGMRPWRLQVVSTEPGLPTWKALWLRYAMATLSLLLGGLGFWWAWVDREKLTWHDRVSGTRMVRLPDVYKRQGVCWRFPAWPAECVPACRARVA